MGTEGYCEVFRLAEVRGAIEVLFSRLNKVAAVDPVWSRTSMNAFGRLRKEGQLLSIAHDVEHGLPTRARVSPQPINSKRRMRPLPLVNLLIPDCTTLNLGYAHSILSKALTTCCQP